MEKTKHFHKTVFPPEVITEAFDTLRHLCPTLKKLSTGYTLYTIDFGTTQWDHDSEDEFFADYRRSPKQARFSKSAGEDHRLKVNIDRPCTDVSVEATTRATIEAVFAVFEKHAPAAAVDEPAKPESEPVVFIGHGRSIQWRDLKDHLHEKHGFRIEAYEVGARAGHAIRDILQDMLTKSSIAFLVLTGEDIDVDGKVHARDNVIHELGLFQGRLGFNRAIALLEEGTVEFSNLHGIQQIRFPKNRIAETYGDVLATIKRELKR
jgi:predicted nucleotide-binding protein